MKTTTRNILAHSLCRRSSPSLPWKHVRLLGWFALSNLLAAAEPINGYHSEFAKMSEIEKRRAERLQAWGRHRQEPYDPLAAAQLALGGFMQNASSRLPGPPH